MKTHKIFQSFHHGSMHMSNIHLHPACRVLPADGAPQIMGHGGMERSNHGGPKYKNEANLKTITPWSVAHKLNSFILKKKTPWPSIQCSSPFVGANPRSNDYQGGPQCVKNLDGSYGGPYYIALTVGLLRESSQENLSLCMAWEETFLASGGTTHDKSLGVSD